MLSDILPTGFECGVLNGKVAPGSTVAIVGAGPIGLAALLTAQFYSPAEIIMIDLDDRRLQAASRFGATQIINSGDGQAATKVKVLTGGRGVDTAIEAVGVPATFLLCQDLVAPGGSHRQYRRARDQGRSPFGAPLVTEYRHHHQAGRHRHHADAAQDRAVEEGRSQTSNHALVQARPDPRRLRDLRPCSEHRSLEGDYRGVSEVWTRRAYARRQYL